MTSNDLKEIDENILISMLGEEDENVKNIIYEKYGYIIDVLLKKYNRVIKALQVDVQELKCEAYFGFSDGLNCYSEHKNTSLSTFLTICASRRINNYLTKYTSKKARFLQEALSLDYVPDDGVAIKDVLMASDNADPLNNLTSIETFEELINQAKEVLSSFEYQVFTYMLQERPYVEIAKKLEKTPKQIDNTIQRIKAKLKKL